MANQSCGTCARRADCAFVLPEALGFVLSSLRRGRDLGERPTPAKHPFFEFLGKVAKGMGRNHSPRETPFRDRVERQLEPLLASGPIRIEEVARGLGYGRQTLYRRLKAEGATFAQVLDSLRHRVALRLIGEEGVTVKEAAWRLGFSDPAAFSRAFKRWTGRSPRAMRR